MNQGTQGYSLTKKTEGRKSRDTVSLRTHNKDQCNILHCFIYKIASNVFEFLHTQKSAENCLIFIIANVRNLLTIFYRKFLIF
jgi:hypothetical protein